MPDEKFSRHVADDANHSDPTVQEEARALVIMLRDVCATLHRFEMQRNDYALWGAAMCRLHTESAVLAFRLLPVAARIGWHPEWVRRYAMGVLSEMLERYASMRAAVPA